MFTSLCDKRLGYKKANATPHMYSMVDHNSKFFDTKKSVKLFTVQGVEKKNNMARTIVLHNPINWML